MKILLGIVYTFLCIELSAQGFLKRTFTKSSLCVQYAGSIGLYSIGGAAVTDRDKLELGLMFGDLPYAFGGPVKTFTFKLRYNPFRIRLYKSLVFEPVQTGFFLTQNFADNLDVLWGSKYPKGYYWWPRSLRSHVFLSAQLSYEINNKPIDRIAISFETNTNDLYLYSYFSNTKALSLYDIIFFGISVRVYFNWRNTEVNQAAN